MRQLLWGSWLALCVALLVACKTLYEPAVCGAGSVDTLGYLVAMYEDGTWDTLQTYEWHQCELLVAMNDSVHCWRLNEDSIYVRVDCPYWLQGGKDTTK